MKSKQLKNYITGAKGFTLIELLVGIAIFAILISSLIGILVSGIELQRESLAQQEMLNQLSYVIEFMSRALRMAREDNGDGCLSSADLNYENWGGSSGIEFINHIDSDKCQHFFLDNSTLKFYDGTNELALTGPKIDVQELRFQIVGGSSGMPQARVTVFLKAGHLSFSSVIELQTTISQRNLNE